MGYQGFDWKKTMKINRNGDIKYSGYPKFWEALARKDVSGMIQQSARNEGVIGFEKRNRNIQNLLQKLSTY